MKKIFYFLLYVVLTFLTWIGLLIVNHFVLVKLSLVRFKSIGVTEVDSYIGGSFNILAMTSFIYVSLFFSQFFYFKEKKWLCFMSIGLWLLTILGIYFYLSHTPCSISFS